MFRIKTDIRQYRCKSREKVERLIRNWVIRPKDLIFDEESKNWQPIGDSPHFAEIFRSLDEAHESQAATVLTERVAREVELGRLESAKSARKTPGAQVLRRGRRKKEKGSGALPIPVAPEGAEGLVRDSDEITQMTEKTLELSNQEDMKEGRKLTGNSEEREEGGRVKVAEELVVTELPVERESRPKRRLSRADLPEEVFATAEMERQTRSPDTSLLDELGVLEDSEKRAREEDEKTLVIGGGGEEEKSAESDGGEEEFDGGEEAREALRERVDHDLSMLREMVGLMETEAEEDDPEGRENLEVGEVRQGGDPEVEAAEGDDELPVEEEAGDVEDRKYEELDPSLRDTADFEEETETQEAGELAREEEKEEVREGEKAGELEIDEVALDAAIDDFEEVAIQAQETEEVSPGQEEIPILQAKPLQNLDMVSAGYKMDLPVEVGPSEEAQARGIKRATASQKVRDRMFSRPYPKRSGTLIKVSYHLGGKPSRFPIKLVGTAVVVGVVLVVSLLAMAL